MFPLVAFPELVEHFAPAFEDVFSPEAFIEFKRYISGLMVSENKTVEGINRLFIHEPRNQSSLNRFLTQSSFDRNALNQARLDLLQRLPGTQMKRHGVLSVDDTLLIHTGEHFELIANLRDPDTGQYVSAHNLVNLHYSDNATDYPVCGQLWKPMDVIVLEKGLGEAKISLRKSKQELKTQAPTAWRHYLQGVWYRHQKEPAVAALYQSKLLIAEQLLQTWMAAPGHRRLPVVFDNWYTQTDFCRFIDQTLGLPYVGTLAGHDQVLLKGKPQCLEDFATHLKAEHVAALQRGQPPVFKPITIQYKGTTEHYWSYCATHRLKQFGRQRLVINYDQADLAGRPAYYISNRLMWQSAGITRIRRHRWPVEVYHEEGKAEGLDQYQIRDFHAIGQHVGLVAVVYSLLRAAPHDPVLRHKLHVNSGLTWRAAPLFGGGRRRPRACGRWP